eukprot:GHVR01043545.1.p2 GENE.GHVR01043545.1~~GHVR01043545.1.p2  ORF type:complete len:139 (+),score=23.57 GHVR01043545.1:67-483(+)
MSITHALISKGLVTLCEYTEDDESILEIAKKGIHKMHYHQGRKAYVYDNRTFNFYAEDDIIYACVGDPTIGTEAPFTFLNEVKRKFKYSYDTPLKESDSRQQHLTQILKDCIDKYGTRECTSHVGRVQKNLDESDATG